MASDNFRFKQFTVWHNRCAMKVGTDGVLLGAWCPLEVDSLQLAVDRLHYSVLDVGTGSGLIALMLAQRLNNLRQDVWIDAIDIEVNAVEQATYNFGLSAWAETLHAHHSTLQEWKGTAQEGEGYDLIVSNPPYFQDSLKNPNAQRATARHTDSLSYSELIRHSVRLLKDTGKLAFVLPIEAESEILALAQSHGLLPTHITHVHTKPEKPAKRLLIMLERMSDSGDRVSESGKREADVFYIEGIDSPRSEEYKELTKDFYL